MGVPDAVLDSTYDALGDRTSLDATIGSTADFQNTYDYNPFGLEYGVIQQGASGGDTVAYKASDFYYDYDNRLESVADYGGPSYEDFSLYEYSDYDHDGNVTSSTSYGYDYTGSTGYNAYGGYGYGSGYGGRRKRQILDYHKSRMPPSLRHFPSFAGHCAVQPPSINSVVPVIYDDAGDARNNAAPTISCSSPHRPMGILATKSAYFLGSSSSGLFMSVANGPGHKALTVTPLVAHSNANTRVRPSNPALDDA